jgi:hypothetical protein
MHTPAPAEALEALHAAAARARAALRAKPDEDELRSVGVDDYDFRRTTTFVTAVWATGLPASAQRTKALETALAEVRTCLGLVLEEATPRRMHEAEDVRLFSLILVVLGRGAEARNEPRLPENDTVRGLLAEPLDPAAIERACTRSLEHRSVKVGPQFEAMDLGLRARARRAIGDAAGAAADERTIVQRELPIARLAALAFDVRAGSR